MQSTLKWSNRFIDMAKLVASWSRDPSTKVGAVIARPDKSIVAVGYNGFPRGVEDNDRLGDRTTRLAITTHAEINAILSSRQSVEGCSIYIYPFPPCTNCASAIIQAGIKEVYYSGNGIPDRWYENFSLARDILAEAGVSVHCLTTHHS